MRVYDVVEFMSDLGRSKDAPSKLRIGDQALVVNVDDLGVTVLKLGPDGMPTSVQEWVISEEVRVIATAARLVANPLAEAV